MAETTEQAAQESARGCRRDPESAEASNICKPYNPDPRTVTWERLETLRLKQLGLSNKYSRHFNVRRTNRQNTGSEVTYMIPTNSDVTPSRSQTTVPRVSKKVNSIAPFATLGKPTCGYFFSEFTENRKLKFGIPPSDLVKWRNIPSALSTS